MRRFPTHYMMATGKNIVVRDKPDPCDVINLCVIVGEDGKNYIGGLAVEVGYSDRHFSKATTRELTEEEVDLFDGMQFVSPRAYGWRRAPPFRVREAQKAWAVFLASKSRRRRTNRVL